MTDRLTPERLAELRRIASYEENCNPNPEDLAVLIGEIDRLAAELAETRSDLIATRASHSSARSHHAASVASADAFEADREQLIAAILRLKQEPRIPMDAWYAYATVLEMARGTKLDLRDGERPEEAPDGPQPVHEFGYQLMERGQSPMMVGRPEDEVRAAMARQHATFPECRYGLLRRVVGPWVSVEELGVGRDAPQPPAEPSAAGFAGTETTEAPETAQRPAQSLPPPPTGWGAGREWALRSTPTPANPHGRETQGPIRSEADVRERAARFNAEERDGWTFRPVYRDTTAWTIAPEPSPYRPVLGIVIGDEIFRTGVLPASAQDVLGLAQSALTAHVTLNPAPGDTDAGNGPQEPAQAVAALRWHYGPTDADPNPGSMWCYACGGEVWSFKDGTLACTKCNATEEPDAIAPEDEGIATADVHAQAAADARTDLRTPEQWEAHYGITVRDPDGWRADNQPWEQPITLPDFWRRIIRSTAGPWAPEIYDRMLHDVNNASAATDGGEPR